MPRLRVPIRYSTKLEPKRPDHLFKCPKCGALFQRKNGSDNFCKFAWTMKDDPNPLMHKCAICNSRANTAD